MARIAPLRPGVEPIRIIQDKTLQKTGSRRTDFLSARFAWCAVKRNLQEAVRALGGNVFLKIGRGGYDGRGQARIGSMLRQRSGDLGERGTSIGARPAVAEQALDLECEISVMAARNPAGEVRSYPAARNHHENQILAWSVLPAGVPAALECGRKRWPRRSLPSSASKVCCAWRCS